MARVKAKKAVAEEKKPQEESKPAAMKVKSPPQGWYNQCEKCGEYFGPFTSMAAMMHAPDLCENCGVLSAKI